MYWYVCPILTQKGLTFAARRQKRHDRPTQKTHKHTFRSEQNNETIDNFIHILTNYYLLLKGK